MLHLHQRRNRSGHRQTSTGGRILRDSSNASHGNDEEEDDTDAGTGDELSGLQVVELVKSADGSTDDFAGQDDFIGFDAL